MKAEKTCSECNEVYAISQYGPKRKDSICSKCKHKAAHRRYRNSNKVSIKETVTKWFTKNHEKVKHYKRSYYKNRKQKDLAFKLKCNMRTRLYEAITRKTQNTEELIGCSYFELVAHLQSKFYDSKDGTKMTIENYGDWQVDHIKPLKAFDLTNPDELKRACHYTNLQPLWVNDHKEKTVLDRRSYEFCK